MKKLILGIMILIISASCVFADEGSKNITKLPEPEKSGGMSLLESLALRKTTREFSDVDFTEQQLANLLWAAAGRNRDDGYRVYPVGMGVQDTFIYVFNRDGIYKYDALENTLTLIKKGDFRAETGVPQEENFVGKASVNLVYVQDLSFWKEFFEKIPKEAILKMGTAHAGAVMQNVYLYAASQGWNSVVRGSFDAKKLSELMNLNENQVINLAHSVGIK